MKSFVVALGLALTALAAPATAQQVPDTSFDTRIAHPAYTTRHPRVMFDEAHHNFHKTSGRYLVFAELIRHDGYDVVPSERPFTAASLAGYEVLVIANALGNDDMSDPAAAKPAFTDAECEAVRDWVRAGGALLLIADHVPMGSAARGLALRFGVDMSNGVTTDTTEANNMDGNRSVLVFSRQNGLLQDHPITLGRDSTERIRRVVAFTGQSLEGPKGSTSFLQLSPVAVDIIAPSLQAAMSSKETRPAAGRSQGLALTAEKGRVVVLGEAAMLSAQLAGPDHRPMGMNVPGSDDRQLALNVMHWLTRVLN